MERQRKCSREMRMSSTGKQNLLQPKLCSSEVALSIESESAICSVRFDSLWPYGLLAHQAPLSMGFTRQGSWSGLSFPSPGDLPNLGIQRRSPALQAGYRLSHQESPVLPLSSPKTYIFLFHYFHVRKSQAKGTLLWENKCIGTCRGYLE